MTFLRQIHLCALLCVLLCHGMAQAQEKDATITFNKSNVIIEGSPATGDDDHGRTWTINAEGATYFRSQNLNVQIGSTSNPVKSFTAEMPCNADIAITSFEVKISGTSSTSKGTITLKVGDEVVTTGSLNGSTAVVLTATDFSLPAKGKTLSVTLTDISNGIKLYYFKYSYTGDDTAAPTIPTYAVTYDANTPADATGAVTMLPAAAEVCDGTYTLSTTVPLLASYRFVGWGATPTASRPITEVTVDGAPITVYALWEKVQQQSLSQHTGALVSGDYIVTYNDKAMNAEIASNRLTMKDVAYDETVVWHITLTDGVATFYNAAIGCYLAANETANQVQLVTTRDDKAQWVLTQNEDGTYDFVNVANNAKGVSAMLRRNGIYGFACYASKTGGALTLYQLSATETVTIGTKGISSFCSRNALDFSRSSAITAYVATSVSNGMVHLRRVTAPVPAATGLLIVGTEGESDEIPIVSSAEAPADNMLRAVYEGEEIQPSDGNTFRYVFGTIDDNKGFFQLIDNSIVANGNYAYIESPDDYISLSSAVRFLTISLGDETVIAKTLQPTTSPTAIYTISGVRVGTPVRGVNIVDGKKMIVK